MNMKLIKITVLAVALASVACGCSCVKKVGSSIPAYLENGVVKFKTEARPAGQQNALRLTADPIDTVRIAIIGLGDRGGAAAKRLCQVDGARVAAVCDIEADRASKSVRSVEEKGGYAPDIYVGADKYKEICEDPDIDLVYICTDWISHTPIALYAMEHGKHVAIEVPSATTLKECWDLVNCCERTRKHCMMLENCVYDFFEVTCLNMARKGLFGEIYHVEGAYIHNLDKYWNQYYDCWRLKYNQANRGDNYPTHGFGPACQLLDIHRSDLLKTIVAMDSESYRGKEWGKQILGKDEFKDGDHTISLLRTEKGKLMEIQHNVYAMRPYSRMYQITGTKGFANKYPTKSIAFGHNAESEESMQALLDQYKPEFVREIEEKAKKVGGHGGMDYIMDYRLISCLRKGEPLDMDVYDLAEWSALSELSRISIENGSVPVEVPDFTRGDWKK